MYQAFSAARRAALLSSLLAFSVAGCAVGPDFKPPAPPAADAYVAGELPPRTASTPVTGGEAQEFQPGADLPGQWWTLFGSHTLEELIHEALAQYPDLAAQQAALRAARENVRAGQGAYFPQFQGTANGEREQVSGASIAPGFPGFIANIFQAGVNVSYTFDLFGGQRRTVEGLQAQAMEQDFRLEASYLTLTTNLAATTIQLASLHDQIDATREIVTLEEKLLTTVERQFALGSQPRSAVLQQRAALAATRATLPALQQQLAVADHQLAVLTGQFPRDAHPATFSLTDFTLPAKLPVSLPAALVAQRPDVRAQEMRLRAANAAIGVATANMLPQLTLTGTFGDESLVFGTLLQPGSSTWNLGAGLTQPLFEGGTLRARRRSAVALRDQAEAQYRLVVLQAFQNVADTLTALDNDARALGAQNDSLDAARASLDLVQRQYASGAANFVAVLLAQQAYQQARIASVSATAARYTDTITLFQALGGGWWNRQDAGTLRVAAETPRSGVAR
jgi:NodT family efflux transporter outer membrane factor (OMF) lipoprotein